MIRIKDTTELNDLRLAATVGFFDGVHVGHRFLIEELKAEARLREGLSSAVITFREHPRKVLHADYQPQLLTGPEEKCQRMQETGVDYYAELNFTEELSRYTAERFIGEVLAGQYHVRLLLVGYDHRFGHNRVEGFEQYVEYGRRYGMEVIRASAYTDGQTRVSSSEVRRLLAEGEVSRAQSLLSYPYALQGFIVNGYQVGRTIGFPTANIRLGESDKVVPKVGVYAVWVYLGSQRYQGMLYIGSRPTVNNGSEQTIEVHILDFQGNIYNEPITVHFVQRIRDDRKFDSLQALRDQLTRDRNEVHHLLSD